MSPRYDLVWPRRIEPTVRRCEACGSRLVAIKRGLLCLAVLCLTCDLASNENTSASNEDGGDLSELDDLVDDVLADLTSPDQPEAS